MLRSCDGLRLHYAEKDAIKHVFLKHSFFGRESVLVRYDFFSKKAFLLDSYFSAVNPLGSNCA